MSRSAIVQLSSVLGLTLIGVVALALRVERKPLEQHTTISGGKSVTLESPPIQHWVRVQYSPKLPTKSLRKVAVSAPPGTPGLSQGNNLPSHRVRAYRRWREMTAGITSSASAAPMWTPMGPESESNVDIGGSTRYVCSGRVTAIALAPASPTIYIGTAGGGVWRLDPGQAWEPLTDSQPSLSIGALTVDPLNSNTIYAATGEQNNSSDEYLGVGILKSTDAGAHWNLLGESVFSNHTIGAIAVSPSDSNVVLAASRIGVYRSTNGGGNWQRVLPLNGALSQTTADSVVFDPANPGVVYASMGGTSPSSQAGVYMSTNSGLAWGAINGSGTGALPVANAGRITLALGPPSSPGLFAGVAHFADTTQSTPGNPVDQEPFIGLYQLVQGNSWKLLASGGNAYCSPSSERSQCDYNNAFAIQPTSGGKPGIMLGGGINLKMSTDGVNWSVVTMPGSTQVAVHSDQHVIVFSPDGSTVYVGNDGGVWSGSISGTNITWTNLNPTLTLAQFYPGLSVNPVDKNISYGGTQDNNLLAFSGRPQWSSVTGSDGAATAIDPVTPTTVWASVAATGITTPIYKSTDGANFYRCDPGNPACNPNNPTTANSYSNGLNPDSLPFPNFLTIDPNHADTLYFTGKTRVYQTTNSAGVWNPISSDLTRDSIYANDQLCHIAVAPTDSRTVYAASCYGAVSVTSSAGPPWTPIGAALPVNMTSYRMTHVIPDPKTSGLLYVTTSQPGTGRVFSTTNNGQTWTDLTNNLADVEVTDLVIDPEIANTLYAATTMGVYWSNTGGQVWSVLGSGLPNSPVTSLVLHKVSRTLRAATHGRGVWDLPIPATANLVPLITQVSPSQTGLNSNPIFNVTGQKFTPASSVLCNGAALATTYVSATQLTAPLGSCGAASDSVLRVAVFTPAPGGGQSPDSFVKVGPAPAIYPGGIVNGASFSGYALAPGAIASIFGANLSSVAGPAQITVPLPTNVNGTAVSFSVSTSSPEPVAAFYVSPAQINIQVPWDAPTSGDARFLVSSNNVTSASESKTLALFAPGIFLLPPTGAPAITFANSLTLPVALSQAPPGFVTAAAKAGDALSIYCTGLGAVMNQPAYGDLAPGLPNLAKTMITPTVLIGGQSALVLYSGLAPGHVGLYQINVTVPPNARPARRFLS